MKTLQLQFWNPNVRAYIPTVETISSDAPHSEVMALADRARNVGRAWRIADINRPCKNPKYYPPRRSSSRSVEDVQVAYVTWAKAKGLTHITIYQQHAGNFAFARWYEDKTYITPEQQFAVEESHTGRSAVIRGNPHIDWRTQSPEVQS